MNIRKTLKKHEKFLRIIKLIFIQHKLLVHKLRRGKMLNILVWALVDKIVWVPCDTLVLEHFGRFGGVPVGILVWVLVDMIVWVPYDILAWEHFDILAEVLCDILVWGCFYMFVLVPVHRL